ncbi:hypothetical protein [Mycobacteroides abscessus]|nr:hypothetical protein [Mycobacteroides abscessus]
MAETERVRADAQSEIEQMRCDTVAALARVQEQLAAAQSTHHKELALL